MSTIEVPIRETSRKRWLFRIGWAVSLWPTFVVGMSSYWKLSHSPFYLREFTRIGWPDSRLPLLACLQLGAIILFLIPPTAVLGCIILTGYLGGAVADGNDEARRGRRVIAHFAGGPALLGHRAIDVLENRPDRLYRLRDLMDGFDGAGGIPLQRVDFLVDFFGCFLGLHCKGLDLGSNHGKAAPGGAGPCRFDRRVERQQRRLPCDLRDQVDHIADRGRGFLEPVDIEACLMRGSTGLICELAGVAHL